MTTMPDLPSQVLPDPADLLAGHPVVFDTETTGLFPDDGATVCAVSVAYRLASEPDSIHYWAFPFDQGRDADKGFVVQRFSERAAKAVRGRPKGDPDGRWDWDRDPNLPESEWVHLLQWLADAGARVGLAGQNVGFDTHQVANGTRHFGGIDLDHLVRWDTMLASRALWPNHPTSLKPTAERLFGPEAVAEAAVLREALVECKRRYGLVAADGPRFDLVPWEVNGPYAAADAVLTMRLMERQMAEMEGDFGSEALFGSEMDLRRVLHRIEQRGLGPVDSVRMQQVSDSISRRLEVLVERMPWETPPTPAQARDLFFVTLGAVPWGPGENHHVVRQDGRVQQPGALTVAVAERMAASGVPHAAEYAEYLRLSTARRMFYQGYLDLMGPDLRLRTSFRQAHVKSGRLSVQRFQAHALPKHLGLSLEGVPLPEPRSLIGVQDGLTRVTLDLSQAELRVAAVFAGCRPMIDLLVSGGDVHGDAARRIFGVRPDDPEFKARRDIAKRTVFGSLFRVGAPTFQASVFADTGVLLPLPEVRSILGAFHHAYPEFARAYDYWERYAEVNGAVPLVDGSMSVFGPADYARSGWNRRVQGSLAVFVRDWLVQVERQTGRYGALVQTVHDSVTLDLPIAEADAIVREVTEATAVLWESTFGIAGGCEASPWER